MKLRKISYCFFPLFEGGFCRRQKKRGELGSAVQALKRDPNTNGGSERAKGSIGLKSRGMSHSAVILGTWHKPARRF